MINQVSEYIVFAYEEPNHLATGLCEGTKLLSEAQEELAWHRCRSYRIYYYRLDSCKKIDTSANRYIFFESAT